MNNYNFENVNVEYLRENCEDNNVVGGVNRVWHDDGNMGVVYEGVSYWFGVGQEVSSSEYNRQCNRLLREAGVVGPRVTGRNN